jgi:hypothetical protein
MKRMIRGMTSFPIFKEVPCYNLLKISVFLIVFFYSVKMHAQFQCSPLLIFGKTNVSEGMYLKSSIAGKFKYKTNTFGIGGQLDLLSSAENRSPVFDLHYTKRFSIKSFPLDVKGFFMYNRFSDRLYETDFGILAMAERQHWTFQLGTCFRTLGITKKAVEDYAVTNDSKIRENFNTMYSLSGYLKPQDHKWNVGMTMTNFDSFVILQETNPMFLIETRYQLCETIMIFIDAAYMNAGALNLSVNPFGYYFKTGIQWDIN